MSVDLSILEGVSFPFVRLGVVYYVPEPLSSTCFAFLTPVEFFYQIFFDLGFSIFLVDSQVSSDIREAFATVMIWPR
jgi:hypothetical protein